MLTPQLVKELSEVYKECSEEEKGEFAHIVNAELCKANAELYNPSMSAKEEQHTDEDLNIVQLKRESIAYRDPCTSENTDEVLLDTDPLSVNELGTDTANTACSTAEESRRVYGILSDFELEKADIIHNGTDKYNDYSYTVRLDRSFIPMDSSELSVIGPGIQSRFTILENEEAILVPPGESYLLMSMESIKLPGNIYGEFMLTDEYLKTGLIGVFGRIRPHFEGKLTFMVHNPHQRLGVSMVPYRGICEVSFYRPFSLSRREYSKKFGDSYSS